MAIQEHAPKWLGALTLPLAAAALACTPGTSARETSSAPPPTNVSAGSLGKCNPVEFAAAIGVPTPAPKGVSLPPYIEALNAMVEKCDSSMTDLEKATLNRVMPLIVRDWQATPAPAGPERSVIPGLAGGGGAPDLPVPTFTPVPSATPRPPELTATVVITPDGKKIVIPPPTPTIKEKADIARSQAIERDRIMQTTPPPEKLPDNAPPELKNLYDKTEDTFKDMPAGETITRYIKNVLYDGIANSPQNPPVLNEAIIGSIWNMLGAQILASPNPQKMLEFARALREYAKRNSPHFIPQRYQIGDYKFD